MNMGLSCIKKNSKDLHKKMHLLFILGGKTSGILQREREKEMSL